MLHPRNKPELASTLHYRYAESAAGQDMQSQDMQSGQLAKISAANKISVDFPEFRRVFGHEEPGRLILPLDLRGRGSLSPERISVWGAEKGMCEKQRRDEVNIWRTEECGREKPHSYVTQRNFYEKVTGVGNSTNYPPHYIPHPLFSWNLFSSSLARVHLHFDRPKQGKRTFRHGHWLYGTQTAALCSA